MGGRLGNKCKFTLLALFFSSGAWAIPQDQLTDATQHLQRGKELFSEGNLDDAIPEFRQAVNRDPKMYQPHLMLGKALDEKGYKDAAIAEFRRVILLAPDEAEAHFDLASALDEKGDRNGAITEYRTALRLNPNNDMAHVKLGVDIGRENDLVGEVNEYREALRINPNNARAHEALAKWYEKTMGRDDAKKEQQESRRLDQLSASDHLNRGDELESQGEHTGAAREYRQAVHLDPDNAAAHEKLGWAIEAKGDVDGAIAEYRKAIEINSDGVTAHIKLGSALAKKRDLNGAKDELSEALRLDPKSALAKIKFGEVLGAQGDYQGEFYYEEEALKIDPENAEAKSESGKALKFMANTKETSMYTPVFAFITFVLLMMALRALYAAYVWYKKSLLFQGTPEEPILAIAMGLVSVHGTAEGDETVPGPVSKRPCYFYEVSIERWEKDPNGKGHTWAPYAKYSDGIKFYLKDHSGRVKVDAHGAEFNFSRKDAVEQTTYFPARSHFWYPGDEELGAMVEKARPGSRPDRFLLKEIAVLSGCTYGVMGTCVENTEAKDEHDLNLIVKGQNDPTFEIYKNSKRLEQESLASEAKLNVMVGAPLAIISLCVLFYLFGWL
jgi:tetratricopeptide (TPR) repeat protein